MGLDLTVKDRGGSIEMIQLKLEFQNFVIRNLTGRESGGGCRGFLMVFLNLPHSLRPVCCLDRTQRPAFNPITQPTGFSVSLLR